MWLHYRGHKARTIYGPVSGRAYDCRPREDIEVDDADAPRLLRMPRAKCNCGHMFSRRDRR